jgi:hypothetical protein
MVLVFNSHISAAHILPLEFYLILMFVGTYFVGMPNASILCILFILHNAGSQALHDCSHACTWSCVLF